MNWDLFWIVLVFLPLASLGYIAGQFFYYWVVTRFGFKVALQLAVAQLIAFALMVAWFYG